MKSINFVLLGDYQIVSELGKKGTTSDIAIYDKKTSDAVYTWTAPITFPDKIQSLMQSINIAEYAILNVTKIDKYLGEQIIALDSVDFRDGFIIHSYEVDEAKLRTLIKNTSVSNFKFIDNLEQLKHEISGLEPKSRNYASIPVMIPIDHVFDVKGVGTVILGVIKQGTIKTYDQLKIIPLGKDVVVKSIQMHDDPVPESQSPARVGLGIKGITAEDISRGDILCTPGYLTSISSGNKVSTKFTQNSFFKEDIGENQVYMISIGLQIKPVKVKKMNDMIEITPEKSIAYFSNQPFVLLKPDSRGIRIIGKGLLP